MTRLPLALAPLDDESWPSYLTRCASQHHTTVASLGSHLGLRDARGRWPGRFGVTMDDTDIERVAPLLGLEPNQVQQMHLVAYDQLALDLGGLPHRSAIAGTRAIAHSAWVWLAGTTFCPRCLTDDGAWRLSWRIPWITTCLRHEVHLHGTCSLCGGMPGLGNKFHASAPPRVAAAPDGRRCPCPRADGPVCGADLSIQSAAFADPGRLRRARVMTALAAGVRGRVAGTARTSLQTLRAWQSAIGIAVGLGAVDAGSWGRTHRWANPPRDPDLIDRLLAAAEPLVSAPDAVAGADVLDDWVRNAGIRSPHANTFSRITQPSIALRPVIDELLGRYGRVHTVIQRRLLTQGGAPFDQHDWDVDDIPQLVWPCALPERLRRSTRPDEKILRAVVALTLVRTCTEASDWVAAGAVLGFPPDKSRNWTRYAFSSEFALKHELLRSAEHLSQVLPDQPQRSHWTTRARIQGFGVGALGGVQAPDCVSAGGAWCPCPGAQRAHTS